MSDDDVNFHLEGTERLKNTMTGKLHQYCIEGGLKSTMVELDAFVDAAKSNGNSHIEHVEPGSSIRRILSKSILRKTLRDFRIKTDHHKEARGTNKAAADNKHVRSEILSPENEGVKLGIEAPAGRLGFLTAISRGQLDFGFYHCPPNMKKRMTFFVGGLVDLGPGNAVRYGSMLRDEGIAVDVVNFYLGGRLSYTITPNQYGGMELAAFVGAAKSKHNSHIVHVEPGSSIPEVLNKSILRKTLRLSSKTNHPEKSTNAAGDNKRVRSGELSLENEGSKLGKRNRIGAV